MTWQRLLLGTVIALGVLAAGSSQFSGVTRGLVLGAGVVAYVSLVGTGALLLSGGASLLSGAMAETSTATALASLKKRRWHIVQGLKVNPLSDIDHVAIGPGGVLVVETKWSSDTWPNGVGGRDFMSDRLHRAIDQTIHSRTLTVGALGDRAKSPGVTTALLVLDAPPGGERWTTYCHRGVHVVRFGELQGWLTARNDDVLSEDAVQSLAARAEELVARHEARDESEAAFTPTIDQLMTRWLVVAPLTFLVALATLAAIASAANGWGYLAGLLATVLVGRRLSRSLTWRPVLTGLIAAEAAYSVVLLVFMAGAALDHT